MNLKSQLHIKQLTFSHTYYRAQKANENYTTSFINVLLSEEGKDFFATRSSILGKHTRNNYISNK